MLITVYWFFSKGGLAQLARALDLHSRGHRFDSDILHDSIDYDRSLQAFVIQHLMFVQVYFSCLTRKTFIDILKRYKKYQPIFFTIKKRGLYEQIIIISSKFFRYNFLEKE